MAVSVLGTGGGVLISAGRIEFNTNLTEGANLWINYTKGDETTITITFESQTTSHPVSADWFQYSVIDPNSLEATPYQVILNGSANYVVSIPQPLGADNIAALFTYNDGSSGTIDVWMSTMNRYS